MAATFPRLIQSGLGNTVSYSGKFLYSRHDPKKNPQKVAGAVELHPNTLLIVPSPLLFYGFETLLERLPEDSHVLCVEIDEQLMAFSLEHAPEDILRNKAVSFIRTDNSLGLISYIDELGQGRFRRVSLLPLSGGYGLHKIEYDGLAAVAERHLQRYWQNRITLIHMGRLWIKNIISNLARHWFFFRSGLPASQKPIVVAGAGESLENALQILKRQRNHFTLLAVDTALPVLTSFGISPDYVVVLEGQLVNSGDFIGHGNSDMSLICDLSAHPSTIAGIRGGKHFVLSEFSDVSFLSRLKSCGLSIPSIRPMGSVGVVAVELARNVSAAPLILTGLDFCFTPGKPHARGALSHILSLGSSNRKHPVGWYGHSMKFPIIQVQGSLGSEVTTNLVLYSYGLDLDEALQSYGRVYDLNRAGIKLHTVSLHDEDEFSKMLQNWNKNVKDVNSSDSSYSSTGDNQKKDQVREFLQKELALIETYLDLFKEGAPSTVCPGDRSRIDAILEKLDYIYIDFPDVQKAKELSDSFLLRSAASAADYRQVIQKALKLLH